MKYLMRVRCALLTTWFTLTYPAFWKSLGSEYNKIISGHVFTEDTWGELSPSPDPKYWPGLVEFNQSHCNICGYKEKPIAWRPYLGV